MNKWTEKSFDLYDSVGYLDRLHNIYPMLDNPPRPLDPDLKDYLEDIFNKKDDEKLFKILIEQDKFPIKDSYKAYFTKVGKKEQNKIIENNPKTVKRICERIYNLGFDEMIKGIEKPIETNRQIGLMFRNWINSEYQSYSTYEDFLNANEHISSLCGHDDFLLSFAKKYLKIDLPLDTGGNEKGLDMVIKINTSPKATFIIGEAKFLTDKGGHQDRQFNDGIKLITSSSFKNNGKYNVIRIAVLDGVCWIKSSKARMPESIRKLKDDEIAISALLLDEFFKSI